MFKWLNSYGANNVVQFSFTIKTKLFAEEANSGWHHQSKGILHTLFFEKFKGSKCCVYKVSQYILLEGLNRFHRANLTLNSDVDQDKKIFGLHETYQCIISQNI